MLICRYLVVGVACGLVGVVPQATDNPFIGVVDNSRHVITETFRSEIKHAGLSFHDEVKSFSRQVMLGKVYHMEIDHKRPGYVIYTDKGSLRSTDGVNVVDIAGTRDQSGYANGPAKDSRFEDYIPYFLYYNETNLLIADSINACLRLLNFELNTVSDYAGKCRTRGHEDGKILQAKFKRPVNMLYGEGSWKNYLYILDNEADAVRFINLKFDYVNTLYRDDKINRPTGLIIHPDSTDKLIVQSSFYIKAIFTHPYKNQKSDPEIIQEVTNHVIKRNNWGIDGPFNEAYLPGNDKLVPVAKDIFVTASKDEGRVRVIDFKKKGVSSICTILRPSRNGEQFRAGTISTCELPHVEGVSVLNSTIYIGTGQGIFGLPVRYTCATSPPNIANAYVKDSSWKADYTCVDGFKKVGGDSTLYCTALKGWGGEHIRCERNSFGCSSSPPDISNGLYRGNNVSVTYECNSGWLLTGDRTLACVNKRWETDAPVCVKESFGCAAPAPTISNGQYSGSNVTGTYQCNPGYSLRGDGRINCINQQWDTNVPVCWKDSFGCISLPTSVKNAIRRGNNQSVTYTCNHGYVHESGDLTINCIEKAWVGQLPTCKKVCVAFPKAPESGSWIGDFVSVKVYCNEGYQLTQGDKTLKCVDGEWVGDPPVCTKIDYGCSDPPPAVKNGEWEGDDIVVKITCKTGYNLTTGDDSLSCRNRKWTGAIPICKRIIYDCSEPPPRVPGGVWRGNETYLTIDCNPGYKMISGNDTLVCPKDIWIGEIPVCFKNETMAESLLETAPTPCPYSLDWTGINLSCVNTLALVVSIGGLLAFVTLFICVAAFRKKRRDTLQKLDDQHMQQEQLSQLSATERKKLNIIVHPSGGKISAKTPDRRSSRSSRGSRRSKSNR